MIILPVLTVLLDFQRSTLIINGTMGPISMATAIELTGIIIVFLVCVVFMNLISVIAASLAFVTGRIMANLYLTPKHLAAVRGWKTA